MYLSTDTPHSLASQLLQGIRNQASRPPDFNILRIHRLGQQACGKKCVGDFLLFT
jgi:hypothetical protein